VLAREKEGGRLEQGLELVLSVKGLKVRVTADELSLDEDGGHGTLAGFLLEILVLGRALGYLV